VTELVGHPLVLVDGAFVQVDRGSARLEVHERSGGFVLDVAPRGLLRYPVLCELEGRDRLVVYALDATQCAVLEVFAGEPIQLPLEARDEMQRTLATLATTFSLASDQAIDDARIAEVPADGQLRVRLRRLGVGVAVRVCVVPLPQAPACAPGHGSARLIVQVAGESGPARVCAVRDLHAERAALDALYAGQARARLPPSIVARHRR
jgi:hypothetical protein